MLAYAFLIDNGNFRNTLGMMSWDLRTRHGVCRHTRVGTVQQVFCGIGVTRRRRVVSSSGFCGRCMLGR
jgi:hypothetical protein